MLDAQTLFKFFLNESVENRLHCLYYSVNLHMFRMSIKPISVYFHYLPFIKVKKKGPCLNHFYCVYVHAKEMLWNCCFCSL